MILKMLQVDSAIGLVTNCYIVVDEKTKETMVVDPGGEVNKILEMLNILKIDEIKYIYLTHCHADHIGAVKELKEAKKGKILIHRIDKESLYNPNVSFTNWEQNGLIVDADSRVEDNDLIHLGNIEFQIIHTPGHTAGSTCLYSEKEKLLFSGDTLFKGTWGRTDLPTGNFEDIIKSITNKLVTLPDDVIVYPGHGNSTRIKEEQPIYLTLRPRLR